MGILCWISKNVLWKKLSFLTKDSRSVELGKRMVKGISLLTKYVIISVFLREREIGLCFSLFLIKVVLEWLLKTFILMPASFYKRSSQSGLSENVLCSSKENIDVYTIPQHSCVYSCQRIES